MNEVYSGYNPRLNDRAKAMRHEMTPEEEHLWKKFLRYYPVHFYRQRPIATYFIADFFCPSAKLVIELDGSQHFTEEGMQYDEMRTELIEQYQIAVLRITNAEIKKNFQGVCTLIDHTVRQRRAILGIEPFP